MKNFILIFCLFISTAGKTENLAELANSAFYDTSRPVLKEINSISFFKYVEQLRDQLKLTPLYEGYDSIQIRIWETSGASMFVTVITRNQSGWEACYYDLVVGSASETYFSPIITERKMKPVSPKSGWMVFSQRLFESSLMTFPDDSKLPRKGLMVDGVLYLIEISTNDQYRFYTSLNPLYRQKFIPEVKSLSEILEFIRSDLSAYF